MCENVSLCRMNVRRMKKCRLCPMIANDWRQILFARDKSKMTFIAALGLSTEGFCWLYNERCDSFIYSRLVLCWIFSPVDIFWWLRWYNVNKVIKAKHDFVSQYSPVLIIYQYTVLQKNVKVADKVKGCKSSQNCLPEKVNNKYQPKRLAIWVCVHLLLLGGRFQ